MKPLLIDKQLQLKDSVHVKQVDLPYMDTPFHFHNAYEIVWIQQSSGHRIVGDNVGKFTDGDLIMMGPNLPHVWYNDKKYYTNNASRKVKSIVTYFSPEWITDTLISSAGLTRLRDLLGSVKRGIRITGPAHRLITERIEQLPAAGSLKRIIHILNIFDILTETGGYECLASSGYTNSYNQKDTEKIDRVYQYVMTHYTGKITLEEAAGIANMTPTAFCKYFKKRTQKTFSNFVNEVRIGYACKLLCDDDVNISEVCYKSGFNNLTNFNKNFKFFTHKNPTDFRNSLRL